MENKIGILEALKDSGLVDKIGKRKEEPKKEPSQSISFKDMPKSGKKQLAAKAGIELTDEELGKQEEKENKSRLKSSDS